MESLPEDFGNNKNSNIINTNSNSAIVSNNTIDQLKELKINSNDAINNLIYRLQHDKHIFSEYIPIHTIKSLKQYCDSISNNLISLLQNINETSKINITTQEFNKIFGSNFGDTPNTITELLKDCVIKINEIAQSFVNNLNYIIQNQIEECIYRRDNGSWVFESDKLEQYTYKNIQDCTTVFNKMIKLLFTKTNNVQMKEACDTIKPMLDRLQLQIKYYENNKSCNKYSSKIYDNKNINLADNIYLLDRLVPIGNLHYFLNEFANNMIDNDNYDNVKDIKFKCNDIERILTRGDKDKYGNIIRLYLPPQYKSSSTITLENLIRIFSTLIIDAEKYMYNEIYKVLAKNNVTTVDIENSIKENIDLLIKKCEIINNCLFGSLYSKISKENNNVLNELFNRIKNILEEIKRLEVQNK